MPPNFIGLIFRIMLTYCENLGQFETTEKEKSLTKEFKILPKKLLASLGLIIF